ncbi:MAG TPA: hypothetical protein VNK23_06605 [Candidatus Dormibacteraeota bacterium]|nr:hypothetical protein [Candidatus Dormibacteraeota bacterium]
MRQAAMLFGVVLLFAFGAGAQSSATSLPPLPDSATVEAAAAPGPQLFAMASPEAAAEPLGFGHKFLPGVGGNQPIYGVMPDYNWQVYAGFSYTRFYEAPGTAANLAGFDFAVAYFPHIRWIAGEGDISATFGSQSGQSADLVTAMGGVKLRWPAESGTSFWAHGLAGTADLSPKTVYGGQHAFSYEFGAGADLAPRRSRVSYRVEADIVATFFFGTYQYSPKITAGVVYRF